MSRKILLGCCMLLTAVAVVAQEEGGLIHFKQRFLRAKGADNAQGATGDSLHYMRLMIAGNIYQTEKHINYCYDEGKKEFNFRDELKYIQPILSLGDITIGNLKTSFGADATNMFSAPDAFALALKYSGINALMHANLHTANVDRTVFNRTRDLMNQFDIYYTGAFSDNFQRNGNYPLIINKKGFRIALLNYGTLNDRPGISRNFYINEIDKEQIEKDMRMTHAYKPDFTIVYLDWGANQQTIPAYSQRDIAKFCFEHGANLVIGTHPNTPMPIEYMTYTFNGVTREGILAYSLGNLIASNDEVRNRNGFLIDMELRKNNYTGETGINDWGIIPVYTYYDTTAGPDKVKMYSLPCSGVENGSILTGMPYIEKRRAINGAYEVRKMIGGTADEIQYNVNEMVANNVMETIDLTNAAWNNKYSMKRKEEVQPGSPPELPVATIGTNNPPSLAKIYDEYNKKTTTPGKGSEPAAGKGDVAANNTYNKEKNKAEQIFNGEPQANTISPVNLNGGGGANSTMPTANAPAKKEEAAPVVDNKIGAVTQPSFMNEAGNKGGATQATDDTATAKAVKPAENHTPVSARKITADTGAKVAGAEAPIALPATSSQLNGTAALPPVEKTPEIKTTIEVDTFYRIQFYALSRPIPIDTNYYTHLKGYEVIQENGFYKYLLGKYKDYKECYIYWRSQIQPRYKESFIVKYISGRRVNEE